MNAAPGGVAAWRPTSPKVRESRFNAPIVTNPTHREYDAYYENALENQADHGPYS